MIQNFIHVLDGFLSSLPPLPPPSQDHPLTSSPRPPNPCPLFNAFSLLCPLELPICTWELGVHPLGVGMRNFPVALPPKKSDAPFPGSRQLPKAPWLAFLALPFPPWNFSLA